LFDREERLHTLPNDIGQVCSYIDSKLLKKAAA
jgi:hypothetical protein